MSRRTTSLAVASLVAASLITLGSASASAKDHADWALEFLDMTTPENNTWGRDPSCYINWETQPTPAEEGKPPVPGEGMPIWSGMTQGACLFTLTLKKSMGYADADIKGMWRKNGPSSDEYFDIINQSPAVGAPPSAMETHFRRVTRAIDIQKGDVFVVGATATTEGHTVIITGAARELLPQINPRYSGTKQYVVPIVDATEKAHGCNESYPDSRWSGPCIGGYMTPGIGTGYMRVYTDSITNILLGYTWSVTSSTTTYYSPSTRPFRIGRLFKLPAPRPTEDPPPPP